jgi:hypothetical protein
LPSSGLDSTPPIVRLAAYNLTRLFPAERDFAFGSATLSLHCAPVCW